jgi:hypothetical protein
MASFPKNPKDGDKHIADDDTYFFNNGVWLKEKQVIPDVEPPQFRTYSIPLSSNNTTEAFADFPDGVKANRVRFNGHAFIGSGNCYVGFLAKDDNNRFVDFAQIFNLHGYEMRLNPLNVININTVQNINEKSTAGFSPWSGYRMKLDSRIFIDFEYSHDAVSNEDTLGWRISYREQNNPYRINEGRAHFNINGPKSMRGFGLKLFKNSGGTMSCRGNIEYIG